MKKIFSFIIVAVLLMTGCVKDNLSLNGNGEKVSVTFTAELPIEDTRALVGDGSKADVVKYAIYSPDGTLFDGYNYQDLQVNGKVATLKLELVKGQSYKIAFWAQNSSAPYTFDRVAKTVVADYSQKDLSNDEIYDAFYALFPITVEGPVLKQVTLFRPFAQINLGATKADIAAAKALGVEIEESSVTLTDVHTTLNLVDGTLGSDVVDVEFEWNALPGNDLTVNEVDYEYLAANYIFADSETDVTNLSFSVKQGQTVINTVKVPSVNYKRNYRTNILGRLLTSSVDFNIVIDGTPEGDLPMGAEAELNLAVTTSGEYKLTNDLVLTQPLEVKEGVSFTLNLNGNDLTYADDYVIYNKGNLTIEGEGQIFGRGGIKSTAGKLVINGGTFTGTSDYNQGTWEHVVKAENTELVINDGIFDATIGGITNAMINISNGSTATINGGTFKNVNGTIPMFPPYMFHYEGDGKLIINNGSFYGGWRFNGVTSTTDIYGGDFTVGYDGQSFNASSTHVLTIYGGSFSLNNGGKLNPANHLADGYKVVQSGDKHLVVEDNATVATSGSELFAAINSGAEVVLLAGDIVLDGSNGGFIPAGDNVVIKAAAGVDAKISGVGKSTDGLQVQAHLQSGNVTFEGLTFDVASLNSGWAMSVLASGNAKVTLKDCTFTGVQSPVYQAGADAEVVIDNCKFACSGVAIQAEVYSGDFQLGQDLTVKDCNFGTTADVMHIYDYDKNPSTQDIIDYLTANNNTFTGTCRQTCQ